jgi:hypothetical protein
MNHRLRLDPSSFQQLLMAAWVLQHQRDLELRQSRDRALPSPAVVKPEPPSVIPRIRRIEALQSPLKTINFKRSLKATRIYGGPVVALLIMIAFVSSLPGGHSPLPTSVSAASQVRKVDVGDLEKQNSVPRILVSAGNGANAGQINFSQLGSTHLLITDPATSAVVTNLSRYEIRTLRRQAQYGDDVAALTLGMAYEVGRHVPQNCEQAARWIAAAALAGNPAAQYNLALRYLNGDGTATNADEAKKWLQAAANHGYSNAKLTDQ